MSGRTHQVVLADIHLQLHIQDDLMVAMAHRAREQGIDLHKMVDLNGTPAVQELMSIRSRLVLAEVILRGQS